MEKQVNNQMPEHSVFTYEIYQNHYLNYLFPNNFAYQCLLATGSRSVTDFTMSAVSYKA